MVNDPILIPESTIHFTFDVQVCILSSVEKHNVDLYVHLDLSCSLFTPTKKYRPNRKRWVDKNKENQGRCSTWMYGILKVRQSDSQSGKENEYTQPHD